MAVHLGIHFSLILQVIEDSGVEVGACEKRNSRHEVAVQTALAQSGYCVNQPPWHQEELFLFICPSQAQGCVGETAGAHPEALVDDLPAVSWTMSQGLL